MEDTVLPIKLEPGNFYIFKAKDEDQYDFWRGYDYTTLYGLDERECDAENYTLVHSDVLGSVREPFEYFEQLFSRFSYKPPDGYTAAPLDVGDILIITPGSEAHAFYIDEGGFYTKIDYFLEKVGSNVGFGEHAETAHTFQTEDDRIRNRPLEDAPLCMMLNGRGVADSDCILADARKAEWIGLPTTRAVLAEAFERLEISGPQLYKWVACQLDNDPDCMSWQTMSDIVTQVSATNIDEVNYLAALVERIAVADIPKLEALVEVGIHIENTADAINLIHNLDIYEFLPGVTSSHRYAQYLAGDDKVAYIATMLKLENEDSFVSRAVSSGQFSSKGFIRYPIRRFEQVYDGKTVPEQYRVSPQPQREKAQKKRDDQLR